MARVVLRKEIKEMFIHKRWNAKSFAKHTGMDRSLVTRILNFEEVTKTSLAAFALHLELPNLQCATDSKYL